MFIAFEILLTRRRSSCRTSAALLLHSCLQIRISSCQKPTPGCGLGWSGVKWSELGFRPRLSPKFVQNKQFLHYDSACVRCEEAEAHGRATVTEHAHALCSVLSNGCRSDPGRLCWHCRCRIVKLIYQTHYFIGKETQNSFACLGEGEFKFQEKKTFPNCNCITGDKPEYRCFYPFIWSV